MYGSKCVRERERPWGRGDFRACATFSSGTQAKDIHLVMLSSAKFLNLKSFANVSYDVFHALTVLAI